MQMLLLPNSRERLLHQFRARDLAPAQQLTKLSNRHAVGSFCSESCIAINTVAGSISGVSRSTSRLKVSRKACTMRAFSEPDKRCFSSTRLPSCAAFLLWRGSADHLNEVARIDPLGEGSAHLIRGHLEIALRSAFGFIKRQPDASPRKNPLATASSLDSASGICRSSRALACCSSAAETLFFCMSKSCCSMMARAFETFFGSQP